MSPGRWRACFAALALAVSAFAILQTLVVPALPALRSDVGTSDAGITWLITAFLISAAVATPILGRLGERVGKDRALIATLGLLGAGSVLGALAPSLGLLIVARVLQGAAGAILPLALGVVRDTTPAARAPGAIGLMATLVGVGGGTGLVLSGPLAEGIAVRWVFWMPAIVAAVTAVTVRLTLPRWRIQPAMRPRSDNGRGVDWRGAALLSATSAGLLLAISEGHAWGWTSPAVLGLLIAAPVLATLWVAVERRTPQPLIDVRLLHRNGAAAVHAATVFLGAGMFCRFALLPPFVHTPERFGFGFGADITTTGLLMVPTSVFVLVVGAAGGRIERRVGARAMLAGGLVLLGGSLLLFAWLHTAWWHIALSSATTGVALGLAFGAAANLVVDAAPPDRTATVTAMNAVVRSIGGAIGAQVSAAVLVATATAGHASERGYVIASAVVGVLVVAAAGLVRFVPRQPPKGMPDRIPPSTGKPLPVA